MDKSGKVLTMAKYSTAVMKSTIEAMRVFATATSGPYSTRIVHSGEISSLFDQSHFGKYGALAHVPQKSLLGTF